MRLNQRSKLLLFGLDCEFSCTFHPHIAVFSLRNGISHVDLISFTLPLNSADSHSFREVFVHFIGIYWKLSGNVISLKMASELIRSEC